MSMSQYCVSWDSYKNNISKGFCRLQQNAEFVDMTLAAEGHFVKVHQNIVALASPYLKQILQSAPCQHPIIFLSNISHNVLSYLLEYIYNGEVKIPLEEVNTFIEACKALHVTGVENFILPKNAPSKPKETWYDIPTNPLDNNYAAHITINAQNYELEVNPIENNSNYTQDNMALATVSDVVLATASDVVPATASDVVPASASDVLPATTSVVVPTIASSMVPATVTDVMDLTLSYPIENDKNYQITPIMYVENSICSLEKNVSVNTKSRPDLKTIRKCKIMKNKLKPSGRAIPLAADTICKVAIPQYSISNRGSVQLLFNRYLYHCHHHSHEGRKRRWRCIDYRKIHCPATIDMDGETIINRAEVHSHPYHDNKILKKFKQKSVFTSLSIAEERINELSNKEQHQLNEDEQDILISQLS